jgi:hypothetical protein
MSAGFGRDNWKFEIFVQNLFDDRGQAAFNLDCSVDYCYPYRLTYPTKPRLVGIKFGETY